MSHWKTERIDFGTMRKNTTKKIIFTALLGIPAVTKIKGDCGCTTGKYDLTSRELTVSYKAGEIPRQVVGDQKVEKTIRVTLANGEVNELVIEGIKTHN